MVQRVNLVMVRGDAVTFPLEIPGVNITDRTIKFIVKETFHSTGKIIEKDITSHSVPAEGNTLINLTEEETILLLSGQKYPFWVQYIDASENKQSLQLGFLEIVNGVE